MPKGATPNVVIKGTREGVSLQLGEGEWDALLEELAERLRATASFFSGARVALDVGERPISADQLQRLEELLGRYDMGLYLVLARSAEARATARAAGVRAISGGEIGAEAAATAGGPAEHEQSEGILVRRTVRSGQVVQHPGHVVIVGDVNPGGEVIAGGNVVIWGRLRGMVHAGAMGDDQAIVCALEMRPMQLRIGNYIARAPEEQRGKHKPRPEVASVREGNIVAVPWDEES